MNTAYAWLMASEGERWQYSPDPDLWFYRSQTMALLRRYARASVEVGRLPSMLGREFFRSRFSTYPKRNFEDVVIFVHDMEQAINKLEPLHCRLVAMNVLEEYTPPEVARLLRCPLRNVERSIPEALDELSSVLLEVGLMQKAPSVRARKNVCQEGEIRDFDVSRCN